MFLPSTIEALSDKIETLSFERDKIKLDLDHHTERAAKYKADYDGITAVINDFTKLWVFAEATNAEATELAEARAQVAEAAANAPTMDHTSRRFVELAGRTHLNYVPNDADATRSDNDLIAPWIPAQRDGEQADGEHNMATCAECADQYEAEQAEDHEVGFTPEQLDGSACAFCGTAFQPGETTVAHDSVQVGAKLRMHYRCALENEAL